MLCKVWYLLHSGFAVQTKEHFLIFDYYKNTPKNGGLGDGVIDISALKDRNVIVFVSHRHGDHYNKCILQWPDVHPSLRLILSDDINSVPGAMMVGKNRTYAEDGFTLETLASNDEGVAFYLSIDGVHIYHAGDLNWWHWNGEPEEYNEGMGRDYRTQVDLLRGKPIDLAFVPVDHRLEDKYYWGIDYLMRNLNVRYAVPMHFGDNTWIADQLVRDEHTDGYREKIMPLTKRGQTFEF